MDTHVKALGILNIAFGVLSAIFGIVTLFVYGGLPEMYAAAQVDFLVAALVASVLFHSAVAIPCMVLGTAVMRYNDNAKSLLIVVSALNLLNVPVGSVIGAYGLWVLLTPETDPLFAEPPRRAGQQKRPVAAAGKVEENDIRAVNGTSILRSRRADAGPH
jgi:hypothetical protein